VHDGGERPVSQLGGPACHGPKTSAGPNAGVPTKPSKVTESQGVDLAAQPARTQRNRLWDGRTGGSPDNRMEFRTRWRSFNTNPRPQTHKPTGPGKDTLGTWGAARAYGPIDTRSEPNQSPAEPPIRGARGGKGHEQRITRNGGCPGTTRWEGKGAGFHP